jgi:hypothetical protein
MKTTARELFPYGAHSAMNVVDMYNVEVMISTGISFKNEEFVLLTGEGMLWRRVAAPWKKTQSRC